MGSTGEQRPLQMVRFPFSVGLPAGRIPRCFVQIPRQLAAGSGLAVKATAQDPCRFGAAPKVTWKAAERAKYKMSSSPTERSSWLDSFGR